MTLRTISLLVLLAALAGCLSNECTSEDLPKEPKQDLPDSIEDWEMYWYHRGADATRAIWSNYRLSSDVALLSDGKGGEPSYAFSTYTFYLLLDNVATFWRKDLAAEAVSAYYYLVNSREISKAVGQNRSNISYFRELGTVLKIAGDDSVPVYECLLRR